MKLPLSVLSVRDLEARVVVQMKNGKYRITFDNIYTCNGSAGIKNGYTDFFIDNISGEFYDKRQLSIAMEVLDKLFTEAVDFSRQGYLATDF